MQIKSQKQQRARGQTKRLELEPVESRLMFYALSGTSWSATDLSVSYVPDGTQLDGGHSSALFAHLDAQHPTSVWQREFARALQTWAQHTPLNFHFVSDDGSPQGTSGLTQSDPRFGDIRLSAASYPASLGFAWFPSSTTRGGDITISTEHRYAIGAVTDLYSLLLHESGHALGLSHSTDSAAVMTDVSTRVVAGLSADDVAGIQALYGARQADVFDAVASNDSLASASSLAPDAANALTLTADLTDVADVDHYRFTVPAGSEGTLTVSVDARGLSLLAPAVRVYDASGLLVGSASAGDAYGTVATLRLSGLSAGQTYVIAADGGSDGVFGMGAYRLQANFGTAPAPDPSPSPAPPPSPPPSVEPDGHEPNDLLAAASDLGRTAGFSIDGLSLHRATDQDYYRFVCSKRGTYALSTSAGDGLQPELSLLDGSQRMLGSASALTVSLEAGQVYYIRVFDPAGTIGSYDLTLMKTKGGAGGGKRGLLRPSQPAAAMSTNDSADFFRAGSSLMDELEQWAGASLVRAA